MVSSRTRDRATIVEVAALAGVSIKTVSRVLNDEPNVRSTTRRKVHDAVLALEYRPNFQARRLKSDRSFLIGILCDDPAGNYAGTVQLGALRVCNEEGYHLVVEAADPNDRSLGGKLDKLVRDSHLDGLILLPPFGDSMTVLKTLRKHALPYCCFAPSEIPGDAFAVRMDDEAAAHEMTSYLLSLGHRRIGFIKGNKAHSAAHNRYAGYRRALAGNDVGIDRSLVEEGDFTYRSAICCADRLLSRPDRPSAIFASNDDMAAAVVAMAYKHHIAVPDELSVAGFDYSEIARAIWPQITTIRQPVYEMAIGVVELLLANLRRPAADLGEDQRVLTLGYSLLRRDSTAPV